MMKVIIAGDFVPRERLAKQMEERRFADVFSNDLRELINSVDFSFVNFESPIVEDSYKPISKCGPNLHCTQVAAEAVKYAGFTGVTMANNHILDYGADGLKRTVEVCRQQGLDVVGVGNNLAEAGNILFMEKNGKTLAVINCCEHEFSVATDARAGANPLNPIRQFYSIQEAKRKADYVIVIVHGGHEHCQLPSTRMRETYRFFIDAGADAVVNHHQHCFSGYEMYNGKPIFYGLGNFCFDINPMMVNTTWNFGFMVEISFSEKIDFRIIPYNQYGIKPTVELLEANALDNKISDLNSIISDEGLLKRKMEDYYQSSEKYEISCLEPYSGRVMGKLYSMGIVPSFIKGDKTSLILNHVDCESHRDKLLFALKNRIK